MNMEMITNQFDYQCLCYFTTACEGQTVLTYNKSLIPSSLDWLYVCALECNQIMSIARSLD